MGEVGLVGLGVCGVSMAGCGLDVVWMRLFSWCSMSTRKHIEIRGPAALTEVDIVLQDFARCRKVEVSTSLLGGCKRL